MACCLSSLAFTVATAGKMNLTGVARKSLWPRILSRHPAEFRSGEVYRC